MLRSAAAAAAVFAVPAVLCAAFPAPAHADERIYAYDSVSPAARRLAPTGLSFEFERHMMGGVRIRRVIQTGERGSAEIKPASPSALGGDLKTLLADARARGDLYEILPAEDGKAFVGAVCPGSDRAWLLIGQLERFRDLTVQALGRKADETAAHKCVALEFSFHGEFQLPPDRPPPRARFPDNTP